MERNLTVLASNYAKKQMCERTRKRLEIELTVVIPHPWFTKLGENTKYIEILDKWAR